MNRRKALIILVMALGIPALLLISRLALGPEGTSSPNQAQSSDASGVDQVHEYTSSLPVRRVIWRMMSASMPWEKGVSELHRGGESTAKVLQHLILVERSVMAAVAYGESGLPTCAFVKEAILDPDPEVRRLGAAVFKNSDDWSPLPWLQLAYERETDSDVASEICDAVLDEISLSPAILTDKHLEFIQFVLRHGNGPELRRVLELGEAAGVISGDEDFAIRAKHVLASLPQNGR